MGLLQRAWVGVFAVLCSLHVLVACDGGGASTAPVDPASHSANARFDVLESLRRKRDLPRHAADGGGRAWLTSLSYGEPLAPSDHVVAGSRARIELRYEVGPHGIAAGGRIEFEVSPFWSWGTPQVDQPDAPGYTTVTASADDLVLRFELRGENALLVRASRALAPGETIDFVHGAGPKLARVDRYAEAESPLWFFVDGDGDGAAAAIAAMPRVDVRAAAPARLVLNAPATAEPGDRITLRAAVLDSFGNRLHPASSTPGTLELLLPAGLRGPSTVELDADGTVAIALEVVAPGVHRIEANANVDGAAVLFSAEAAPIVARRGIVPVLWADLHGHSLFSDGTGTPEAFYRYARDVAGLDVAALTDHDHWGMSYLDERPDEWQRIRRAVAAAHAPGDFVALLGYEWTSWIHGHRHVLYFDDGGDDSGAAAGTATRAPAEIHSFVDEATETPAQLWAALAGREALTFAHHSAGGPIATNWDYRPDPRVEPVTEIVSAHGSSEAPDSPRPIYDPVRGNYVRDLLGRGLRVGFIGSGDGHDGHPGLTRIASASGNGGLAALVGAERSREGVLEALRARRTYATSGARIYLNATLDGHPMGALLPLAMPEQVVFEFEVASETPIERVELIRSGRVHPIESAGERRREWKRRVVIPALYPGETVYLRVVQQDRHAAWTSPFFCCESR